MFDCDWSFDKLTEVNFLKFTHSNKIFRNDFVCIHYHICKISAQIIEIIIFTPYDFLQKKTLSTLYCFKMLVFKLAC